MHRPNQKPSGKLLTAGLVLSVSLGLSACGYQLRGTNSDYHMPESVQIFADNEVLLQATVDALHNADVATSQAKFVSELSSEMVAMDAVRIVNTSSNEEAVIFNSSGTATHWRYTLSTQVILGLGDNAKTINLSEQQQIDLSGASSTANDRIITAAWEELYQRLAQRILGAIGS